MPGRNDISKGRVTGLLASRLISFVLSFLFFVALPLPAPACSYSLATVRVSPDFRVIVRHGSAPVPGIQIEVYSEESKLVLRLATSLEGVVEIKNLRPGKYLVQTGGPGRGGAVYAEVAEKPENTRNEISLEWPFTWRGTLKTRSLSGELVSNDPDSPFQDVQVQLWAAGLEIPMAKVDTGPQGSFRFDETQPGIYVIRVQGHQDKVDPNWQIEGDLSVELSPSSPDALPSLALRLGMTSCGIVYSTCLPGNEDPMVTASRRLRVMNEPGVSENPGVENAKYKLLGDHGALIAEGTTDRNGTAELPSEVVGKATLVVASSGLTTLQQPLELLPLDESAPGLVVTMSTIVGSATGCSVVTLEKHATPQ
jgi:hypothetical protein